MLHKVVEHVGEDGVVHLNKETGVVYFEILLTQSLGDSEDVLPLVVIELVNAVESSAGGSYGGKERFFNIDFFESRLKICDGAANGRAVTILDRAHACFGGAAGYGTGHFTADQIRETLQIAPKPMDWTKLIWPNFEARNA